MVPFAKLRETEMTHSPYQEIVPIKAKCTRCGEEYMQDYFILCEKCLQDYIDFKEGAKEQVR